MTKRLEGKVALITGSGRGIGRALALRLAGDGATVVINDIDAEPAEATAADIRAAGGKASTCVGSVTDPEFAARFVKEAVEGHGGLDIIVSNAGYTRDSVIQKMDDAQFQAMLDVHLIAPFRILREALGPIKSFAQREREEGREVFRKVVLVSSIAGFNGNPGQVNYSSAKAGLIGMTKTLSKEWGRYKVCVNCVGFGLIDTRLTASFDDPASRFEIAGQAIQAGIPDQFRESVSSMIPLGRSGKAEEAAGGIAMFCGPDSDYVSGQVLLVAGGMDM